MWWIDLKLKFGVALLLVNALSATSLWAVVGEKDLQQLSRIAYEHCSNEQGKFDDVTLSNTYLESDGGAIELCVDYLERISFLEQERTRAVKGGTVAGGQCLVGVNSGQLGTLVSSSGEMSEVVGCEKPHNKGSCLGGVGCDLFYSVNTISDFVATKLGLTSVENPPSKILAKGMISTMQSAGMEIDQGGFLDGLNSCVKTENRNCFSTLIKGVVDNLTDTWGMVKSVGGWLKKAPGRFWNWTKKKVSSAKNYFNSLDSFSTMRMHMASAMSDVDLAQWAKNRWSAITTFAGNLGGAISKMFTEAMVSDYGCPEKVRGKCVTPMDVNCMNCRDYMRAFCGFVGYIAPEILLAISSGGATAAGGFIKRLLSNSSKMTKKVSRRMNRLMNPIRNKMVLNAHRGHSLRMKEINSSLAKFKPKTMGVNYLKTTAKADKKLVGKACNLYW